MNYFSVADVIFIHDDLIAKYGGALGIRDEGLLESAVFRCRASFDGEDLYKTVFEKAAALFHAVIFDHPFVDGNKRTAITSAALFLEKNGWDFRATDKELITFPLFVEKERPGALEIAEWFKDHARRRQGRTKSRSQSKRLRG